MRHSVWRKLKSSNRPPGHHRSNHAHPRDGLTFYIRGDVRGDVRYEKVLAVAQHGQQRQPAPRCDALCCFEP